MLGFQGGVLSSRNEAANYNAARLTFPSLMLNCPRLITNECSAFAVSTLPGARRNSRS